ncbi:hypothetical protein LLEC1_02495 [Akanthomyces lecanii]|uniref:N-acetyltransferase domain-containing protein n=1 Tax=Cordyceps confragosa TaxID=2714763 RepID=A0A179IRV4_CORDF|nr:hypothetical protein LLEC1_02495 [Akanthomyces lecanii]
MAALRANFQSREWRRDGYLITTDSSPIPLPRLVEVFNSKEFYWANAMPLGQMQDMLENSLCFSLFRDNGGKNDFLGFARCITDYTTFLYMTDVWVDPAVQGKGLGRWMVQCVQQIIEEIPHLRRSLLFTSSREKSVPFYQKYMDMTVIESKFGDGPIIMERKGPGNPKYKRN